MIFTFTNMNFEHIVDSVHTTEFSALKKASNIYINCLIF